MKINTEKQVGGLKLFDLPQQPVKELAELSEIAATEGAVLVKNDNNALPLKNGEKIAVFGRIQTTYYKSGTGSGGMVNVEYVTDILSELEKCGKVTVDETVADTYRNWIEQNPFDKGKGWAQEPWCQKEMPLDDELVNTAAANNDAAIVVIGRTAGEDKDNHVAEGSMLLNEGEREMLRKVCGAFKRVIVLLNVGNIIDMSFVDDYDIDAVMYLWQGGQEGGKAAAQLLCGDVTPCGKLADTVAYSIDDYPARKNFGDRYEAKYEEDIYVGYRYFETVAKDKVRYEFGFGLSYTDFDITVDDVSANNGKICVTATVKNIGEYSGKEVVQVYYGAPQGVLGKPLKQLAAYKKPDLLNPGEQQQLEICFDIAAMASYDDAGVTGNKSAFVLEAGDYVIFVGNSVRNAKCSYTYNVAAVTVTEQLEEALSPVKDFQRMHPIADGNTYKMTMENVPKRTYNLSERIASRKPADIAYTGDKGIKLVDVADGKATMEQFVAQISTEDLCAMVKGEGMNSPKVTAGTGGAFGGITDGLIDLGIPVVCCTDGPSGIRMDSGAKATAMPNGTCLACTFNDELVERLYDYEGAEMFAYNIDALLGPGMNIHRDPLNVRNFEYFSEDPLLTGKMAAAITRGIQKSGCTPTIKHFCANNQEFGRSSIDSVVSERALREIYLKPFEMAVKQGGATCVMTSYGSVNGFWTMGSYDLDTTILRNQWGFDGIVMSDWWAVANHEGEKPYKDNLKQMVRAQNDLFMVCANAQSLNDNLAKGLSEGFITIGELQRSAMNICKYVMNSPTFEKYVLSGFKIEKIDLNDDPNAVEVVSYENVKPDTEYIFDAPLEGNAYYQVTMSSTASELAQIPVIVNYDGEDLLTLPMKGSNGESITIKRNNYAHSGEHKLKFRIEGDAVIEKVVIKMKLE